MQEEIPYWMALAHLPSWSIGRKNELIVRCFEAKQSIIDLFSAPEPTLLEVFGLHQDELSAFQTAQSEVANYAFLAEDLLNQGYQLLPITAENYPKAIKKHLKKPGSPPLFYAKGDLSLLNLTGFALAAPPKPNEHSLQFTTTLTARAGSEGKFLATSGAKGIEATALEVALEEETPCILVIPQGIQTYGSGFRNFYKPINQGRMLVLSPHPPTARSNADLKQISSQLAFALAEEIYIVESKPNPKNWVSTVEKKLDSRRIFIRIPEPEEKNGNAALLTAGGTAVDLMGKIIH